MLHVLAIALAAGLLCRLLLHGAASGLVVQLAQAMVNTLVLVPTATLLGAAAGMLLGIQATLCRSRWPQQLASPLAVAGVSLPHCWLGLALVAAFSVSLGWLPVLGAGLLLPALALGVIPAALAMRSVRGLAIETLQRDRFALQMLAAIALQLRHLVGGALLLEIVFDWPGAGQLLHTAIFQRDTAVLQGTVLVLIVMFALIRCLARACHLGDAA